MRIGNVCEACLVEWQTTGKTTVLADSSLDDEWNEVAADTGGAPVLHVKLPRQHSAAHRIALAEPAHAGAARSLIVTGLLASVLFQILPDDKVNAGSSMR